MRLIPESILWKKFFLTLNAARSMSFKTTATKRTARHVLGASQHINVCQKCHSTSKIVHIHFTKNGRQFIRLHMRYHFHCTSSHDVLANNWCDMIMLAYQYPGCSSAIYTKSVPSCSTKSVI